MTAPARVVDATIGVDRPTPQPGLTPRPVPELPDPAASAPTVTSPTPTPPAPTTRTGLTVPAPTATTPAPTAPSPTAGRLFAEAGRFALVLLISVAVGYLLSAPGRKLFDNRMLPWILGRSLGVATYLTLTALVVIGLWLRHPWRTAVRSPGLESLLRAHVALAAATGALLIGHLSSLALDRYAGVGWAGAFVPGQAHYRPTAVALGTVALYAFGLVGLTAALAGVVGRRIWFPIHSVSGVVFGLCLVHGLTAGSDSPALRWMYVATGVLVVAAQVTRVGARWAGSRSGLEVG